MRFWVASQVSLSITAGHIVSPTSAPLYIRRPMYAEFCKMLFIADTRHPVARFVRGAIPASFKSAQIARTVRPAAYSLKILRTTSTVTGSSTTSTNSPVTWSKTRRRPYGVGPCGRPRRASSARARWTRSDSRSTSYAAEDTSSLTLFLSDPLRMSYKSCL